MGARQHGLELAWLLSRLFQISLWLDERNSCWFTSHVNIYILIHVWLKCFFFFDRLQVKVRAGKEGPRLLQLFHHVRLPAAAPAATPAPAHTSASLFLLFLLVRSFRSWKCSHSNAGSPARQHYRQLVWLLWHPEARWCRQAVQQQRGFAQTALQGLWW